MPHFKTLYVLASCYFWSSLSNSKFAAILGLFFVFSKGLAENI